MFIYRTNMPEVYNPKLTSAIINGPFKSSQAENNL